LATQPDNLVNSNAPFEKFIVDDPTESKEYLASRHYSQSYNRCIDDVDGPPRQLFFPFDIYLDKSGKMARITSSCGEPVLMTTPLLKSSVREGPSSWCLLGFIPDLEKLPRQRKHRRHSVSMKREGTNATTISALGRYWSQFSARLCRDSPCMFTWAISFTTWK
jgi:hypothetical protein